MYLVMNPDMEIVNASDAYLSATFKARDAIQGRNMFDAFPDNPSVHNADGVHNLRTSLRTALRTGVAQRMRVQRYDVLDQTGDAPKWVEKHWSLSNLPVFAVGSREILYLLHLVEDVTALVRLGRPGKDDDVLRDALEIRFKNIELNLLLKSESLDSCRAEFTGALRKTAGMRKENAEQIDRALARFDFQVSDALRFLAWQKPLQDAISETDPLRFCWRLRAAEWAVSRRSYELSLVNDDPVERAALDDATPIIAELKRIQ